MDVIQNEHSIKQPKKTNLDAMNNEISSTSNDENIPNDNKNILSDNILDSNILNGNHNSNNNKDSTTSIYNQSQNGVQRKFLTRYKESPASDNDDRKRTTSNLDKRNYRKSTGNIHQAVHDDMCSVQNSVARMDLITNRNVTKRFESLQIPIVGYEVMEERARFTIYKLKVEDDKRDQSWLVFRRYTDFVRLYSRIKNEMPTILLPLPGKRWFKNNFDPAFIEDRVRGLQIFVNAILKSLPNHPIVREFFCLDEPPQELSYQPEVQAVYGALEDSIGTLKMQLKQKDATIMHLQKQLSRLESVVKGCSNCSTSLSSNSSF